MKLFLFFLHYSRRIAILAIVAGIISGVSSTGMLAVINASLRRNGPAAGILIWAFVALCLLLPWRVLLRSRF
jgi:putative ATP-binding cassette transporter